MPPDRFRRTPSESSALQVYGINPVMEALEAGRLRGLRLERRAGFRLQKVAEAAEARGVPVRWVDVRELDRAAPGAVHQGVVGEMTAPPPLTLTELLRGASTPALLIVLDGIEDPQNLGAILRSADAAGADGVIRQTRHAAPLGGATAKASAGAVAHVRVADVVNIARALEALKQAGIWTVGLVTDADRRYDEVDLTLPTAFVIGAEGTGLRRLVRERCDWLVSIPMRGHVASLNAAVATAVALYEAVRQRLRAGRPR